MSKLQILGQLQAHSLVSVTAWFALLAAGWLATALSLGYARWAQLSDLPGERRLHAISTPRGGGLGLAVLLSGWSMAWPLQASLVIPLFALLGAADDHGSLSARFRLVAQLAIAGIATSLALPIVDRSGLLLAALLVLLCVWLVNLTNFMDGVNGLCTVQAVIFGFGLVLTVPELTALGACLAALSLGFLPFNFPRARIFLGDVGSYAIGAAYAYALLFAMHIGWRNALAVLLLLSAFVTDASWTLLTRAIQRRRIFRAHREHLYQWLKRSGWHELQLVGIYAVWMLLSVLLVLILMRLTVSAVEFLSVTAAWYALASALWWSGKRRMLQRVPRKVRR